MYILGVSAFYHDSAACLIHEGEIIAAAQEERFTRKKHDDGFPTHAVQYCVEEAGVDPSDIAHVVFYEKPFLKFERLLETYLAFAPRGFRSFASAMPLWVKDKLFQKSILERELSTALGDGVDWKDRLLFSEHHLSHAASAFYPSPFESAAVLTLDGVGEWTTTSLAVGNGKDLHVHKEIHFPHSLGLLYSAFTYYTGFKVNSGEYKVMGLAPYGEPRYVNLILEHLIDLKPDGTFRLDMQYFNYCTGLTMTNQRFDTLFGGPPRIAESEITQREMDLAASIQVVTETVVLRLAETLHKETGQKNLCLAGGVALNCVANGRLLRESSFENIWVQPAAGDAGGSLGAALVVAHQLAGQPREVVSPDAMRGAYLGPAFSSPMIREMLDEQGAVYQHMDRAALAEQVAQVLAQESVVGWFQGRMEFGPRALGGRSIIGDPRSPEMQSVMNQKIKFRESFRPFAPSVLEERVAEYFDLDQPSPYMLVVAGVRDELRVDPTPQQTEAEGFDKLHEVRSRLPAITHVDHSARIQTVSRETNPRYYALLKAFEKQTGCGVLVNTSFNVRGEPIVCSPQDAYRCFMRTNMDYLVVEDYFLKKASQPEWKERDNWQDEFELD